MGWDEEAQSKRFERSYKIESFEIIYCWVKGWRPLPYRESREPTPFTAANRWAIPKRRHRLISYQTLKKKRTEGKALTLSVFKNNPATNLYQRLDLQHKMKTTIFTICTAIKVMCNMH